LATRAVCDSLQVRESAAADAACHYAREEIARPAPIPKTILALRHGLTCRNVLPGFHPIPKVLINDAQVRHVGHDPFGFRIETGTALAGLRVLDETLPVPDQAPDIQLVIENPAGPLPVAMNGARTPGFAGRAGIAFLFSCFTIARDEVPAA